MRDFVSIPKIDAAIRFFIYLLIFWLPYSPAVVESCVSIGLALWIIKRIIWLWGMRKNPPRDGQDWLKIARDLFVPSSFLNKPIGIFLIACVFSVVGSISVAHAFSSLFTKTLEWFIIYFLVLEVFQEKKYIHTAFVVFVFTALSTCLDSLWQFHVTHRDIFLGHQIASDGRANAGFKHSNDLAGYLLFVIPFLMFYFLRDQKKKIWKLILLGISLWSIVLTFSRGAWIGLLLGFLFSLMILLRKKWIALTIWGVLIGLMGTLILSSSDLRHKMRLDQGEFLGSMLWRTGLWADTLRMIYERPFFGHGVNTYMQLSQQYRRKNSEGASYNPSYAHNCYLQIAAEAGTIGLIAFLGIIFILFNRSLRSLRSQRSTDDFGVLLQGILVGIFCFLTHSFMDTNFYSLQLSAWFWVMTGIYVAGFKILNGSGNHDIKLISV